MQGPPWGPLIETKLDPAAIPILPQHICNLDNTNLGYYWSSVYRIWTNAHKMDCNVIDLTGFIPSLTTLLDSFFFFKLTTYSVKLTFPVTIFHLQISPPQLIKYYETTKQSKILDTSGVITLGTIIVDLTLHIL